MTDLSKVRKYQAAQIFIHKGYSPKPPVSPNDIALIRLNDSIEYTSRVNPISLPADGEEFRCGKASITGFGRTGDREPPSKYLLLAVMDILKEGSCTPSYIPKEQILCMGQKDGSITGTCYGDSGGPLVKDGKLIGITSYGTGPCGAGSGSPDGFTKVSKHIKWIKEVMGKGSDCGCDTSSRTCQHTPLPLSRFIVRV